MRLNVSTKDWFTININDVDKQDFDQLRPLMGTILGGDKEISGTITLGTLVLTFKKGDGYER